MRYRAALFDFDGTLTPSLPLWVKAFHIAVEPFGMVFSDEEVVKRFFFRDWQEVADEIGLSSQVDFREQMHGGLRVAFHEAELFPDVLSIIRRCREQGLQVALVTSAPRFIIEDVMPRLHLHDLFHNIVCADDVRNFKPHPEPVLMALSAIKRNANEAIMIGDATVDILAGKAVGTATALFMPDNHGDFHHTESLRATEPDHIFANHTELPEILGLRN